MNLWHITEALVELLEQVPGVSAYPGMQDSVLTSGATTAIVVRADSPFIPSYHQAMSGGRVEILMVLEIICPRSSMRDAQQRIFELLSAGTGETASLIDTLRPNDRPNPLDGLVHDFTLMQVSGLEERTIGDLSYVGCDISVRFYAART